MKFILAVENFFTPVTFESCAVSITFQLMSSTEKCSTWWWLVTLFTLEWHSCWLFLKSSSHSSLFKCFQLLRDASCWNFNQFFNNSAFLLLFTIVRFQMSPEIAWIALFFKILWSNTLAMPQYSPRAHIKHKQFIKKHNSWGGQSWWLMDSELPTSGLLGNAVEKYRWPPPPWGSRHWLAALPPPPPAPTAPPWRGGTPYYLQTT